MLQLPAAAHWVAFSPDGTKLLTLGAGADGPWEARVWDAQTGAPLTPPLPHPQLPVVGEFSPDGASFLTGSTDGRIRRFAAATGALLGEPLVVGGWVREAHFSPDGRHILSGNSPPASPRSSPATGSPTAA